MAYKDPNKFGPDAEPWCKQGQWVCIGRYAGSRFKIDGGEVRIINDDEVIATILEPDDVKHIQERVMSEETEIKQTGDAEEPVVVEVEETGSEAPEEKVVEQEPEVIVEQEATEEPSDELETYSKNVQNRIKKQTAKYHQEKRDKEEAQRVAQQLLQNRWSVALV